MHVQNEILYHTYGSIWNVGWKEQCPMIKYFWMPQLSEMQPVHPHCLQMAIEN